MKLEELIDIEDVKEYVNDKIKDGIIEWLKENFPSLKEFVEKYKEELKASAKEEHGWCKFRDAVFLPLVFTAGMYIFETTLDKILKETLTKE